MLPFPSSLVSFYSAPAATPLQRSSTSFLISLSVLCLPWFLLLSAGAQGEGRGGRPVWSWRLSQSQWAHLEAKLVVFLSCGTHTLAHTHTCTCTESPPLIFSQTLSLSVSNTHTHFHSHFKAPWLQGFEGLNTVYLQPHWLIGFLCTHTPEAHARAHARTQIKSWMTMFLN